MPKNGLTEIILIMDRSTSMTRIREKAIEGFNAFLEEQKKAPGQVLLTLVFFSRDYEVFVDRMDINEIAPLNEDSYVHKRGTALLDTMGPTLEGLEKRIEDTEEDERPEKVVVAVITDGEDVDSWQYSTKAIRYMIKFLHGTYGWEFVFIAANQDAFIAAAEIGIPRKSSMSFDHTDQGVTQAFKGMSGYVTSGKFGDDDDPGEPEE